MTIVTPSALGLPSVRTLEWLAGSDLLTSAAGTSTEQLAGLGPVASLVETSVVGDDPAAGETALPGALTEPANQAVLETHAQLEETGHQVTALNGPLHGLTNLGETVGLGHLGSSGNLVTDVASIPQSPDASSASLVLSDTGAVAQAAGALAETVPAVASQGGGLVGKGGLLSAITDALNQDVLGLHASLEEVGHQNPTLNGPIHGLTGLGEAIGLGHIGSDANLLTDVVGLPGAVVSGNGVTALAPMLNDVGNVTNSLDALLNQVTDAPGSNGGLLSPNGLLAPAAGLANAVVLNLHAGIEGVGHDVPVLNGVVHGVTGLGETIGLGHLGEAGNLVTDIAALPGSVLSGAGTGTITPVLADAGAVLGSAGTLVDAATGMLGSGADGAGGILQPVSATLAPVVITAGTVVGAAGGLAGTVADTLGHVGETGGAVVHDVAGAIPTLVGDVGGILDGAGAVVQAATGTVDTVGGVTTGLLQPVVDGVGGLVATATALPAQVADSVTGVLLHDGGGSSPAGSASGGLVGGLANAVSPTNGPDAHPLVDVAVGPSTSTPILDANLLSAPADTGHAVQVSAVDVGGAVPVLAGVSLLAGDGIPFPAANSGGVDSLVGHALDLAPTASPTHVDAAPPVHVDLAVVSLDVGGHADAHVADAQPHTAPAGLHLLGL